MEKWTRIRLEQGNGKWRLWRIWNLPYYQHVVWKRHGNHWSGLLITWPMFRTCCRLNANGTSAWRFIAKKCCFLQSENLLVYVYGMRKFTKKLSQNILNRRRKDRHLHVFGSIIKRYKVHSEHLKKAFTVGWSVELHVFTELSNLNYSELFSKTNEK